MFIHLIDVNFVVPEEITAILLIKGSTRGCDLLESFNSVTNKYNLKLSNVAQISTDGVPPMQKQKICCSNKEK